MSNLETIKGDFQRIKELGFIETTRPNNKDGGIGNTYEDLLGVKENNLKEADYLGFEIKSKRKYNSSYISLFSKSPTHPKGGNSYLRENYGEVRDPEFPDKKKLYASVFGHRFSIVYEKYKMKLKVDYTKKRMYLLIFNLEEKLLDEIYWSFADLEKATKKMKDLMLVFAETKKENKKVYYYYNNAEIFKNFSFIKFLKNIETGGIMFDLRIGVYNSGKNIGKTHDHGSGFRVTKEKFKNLYDSYEIL